MKDRFIIILMFIILILGISLYDKCGSSKPYIKSDTVVITKSDTIWAKDTLYVYKRGPKVTDSVYIKDTLHVCDYVRTYVDTINDTNITIVSENLVRGEILGGGLKYKLKVPIIIKDSIFTTVTNTIDKTEKYSLSGGLILTKNTIAPTLSLTKNKVTLQGGYDLNNRSPLIGLNYKLYSK